MKNLILGLFIIVSFTACKKNEETPPDAGTVVAGTYQASLFGINDGSGYKEFPVTTPPTTVTSVVSAERTGATSINLAGKATLPLSVTSNVVYELPKPFPVTLQQNGNSYDMMYNTLKIGTADGTNIAIDITQPASGTTPAGRIVFKGKK